MEDELSSVSARPPDDHHLHAHSSHGFAPTLVDHSTTKNSSMSSPSRSLASLPELVLREVLAYLLVDTPRAHHRTAVLSTCSTLHDLGLPYLYRIVDIISTLSSRLASHLTALFGPDGGLLTTSGRHQGLGRSVVELRVGAEADGDGYNPDVDGACHGVLTRLIFD